MTNQATSAATTAAATAGATVGKTVSGVTSTVSNVFNTVKTGADNALAAVKSSLPIGEIQNKLSSFADTANNFKGDILSLANDQKNTLVGKISDVANAAAQKGLDFAVDASLTVQNAASGVQKVLGKHTYPSTETLDKPTR